MYAGLLVCSVTSACLGPAQTGGEGWQGTEAYRKSLGCLFQLFWRCDQTAKQAASLSGNRVAMWRPWSPVWEILPILALEGTYILQPGVCKAVRIAQSADETPSRVRQTWTWESWELWVAALETTSMHY